MHNIIEILIKFCKTTVPYGKQWTCLAIVLPPWIPIVNKNGRVKSRLICISMHLQRMQLTLPLLRLKPFLFGLLHHVFYWRIQNAIKYSEMHYQNPFKYIKVRSMMLLLGILFTGLLNQSKVSFSVLISDPRTFGQVSVTFLFVLSYCNVPSRWAVFSLSSS